MTDNDINFFGDLKKQFSEKTTQIAQEVFSELEKEDIPALPENFEAFFERYVGLENQELKEAMYQKAGIDTEYKERLLGYEKEMRNGVKNVRQILEVTKEIYQSVIFAHNATKRKANEILKVDNPIAFKSAIQLFFQDFENLQATMQDQIKQMQQAFSKIAQNIENINNNSIYDTQYGVYNKKYFVFLCEKEKSFLDSVGNCGILVSYGMSRQFLKQLRSQEHIKVALKTLAKILNKNTQSNDISCYFGAGKFLILHKYIGLEKVLEKIKHTLQVAQENNLVLGDNEVSLGLCAGIAPVNSSYTLYESLELAVNACDRAFGVGNAYEIGEKDK